MPEIIFIAANGDRTDVEAEIGSTVMEVAVRNDVAGIIGECGGSAMCGTCHVYVAPSMANRLPPPRPEEDATLDETACERRPNSRLGCQIKITNDLIRTEFSLPERQI